MAVNEYLIGNSVVLTATVTTPEGTPENPTGINLHIEEPDGTIRNNQGDLVVETNTIAGTARCVFQPNQVGVYAYRWFFSGFPGGAEESIFRVRPSGLSAV